MLKSLNLNSNYIRFGIPFVMFGVLISVMKSPFYSNDALLNMAIVVDLLISVPIVYFLLIRKTKIPKTTVVPIMVIGLLIGTYFLPSENQFYLSLFKTWVLPLVELTVIAFVSFKVSRVFKRYKSLSSSKPDFFDSIKEACQDLIPEKMVTPFATEIAMFYYGFVNWRKNEVSNNEFTYHKKSATYGILGAFLMVILIETVALHVLLSSWNPILAWILTAFSVYSGLQVFGIARSLSKRPIVVTDSTLFLKFGIANEMAISYDSIESLVVSSRDVEKENLTKSLSILGELDSHNIILKFKTEHELYGIYGMRKKVKTLLIHVDEATNFKLKVDELIASK